jgi:hypothetical protein
MHGKQNGGHVPKTTAVKEVENVTATARQTP